MVKLNKVDVSALNNTQIKNFLRDASSEEGIYKIETKSNKFLTEYPYNVELFV